MSPRVLLLCGGQSAEHEVSLSSARSVLRAAGGEFSITPLVIDKSGKLLPAQQSRQQLALAGGSAADLKLAEPAVNLQALDSSAFDVVFPLLHGPLGEDGSVQGMLKLMGLPFVGSDVLGSAVGMDKIMMKTVFAAHHLPQLPWQAVSRSKWRSQPERVLESLQYLDYPLFVKPANLGSSVGISKVHDQVALRSAIDEAASYDRRIVIEQGLEQPRELEVAILGNDAPEVSPVGEISFTSDFYDYATKYTEGCANLQIPAAVSDELCQQIQVLAVQAFEAIDARGLARVDFFLDDQGRLYLNEINTMPGFTTTSMYPKLFEAAGVSYPQLVRRLIHLALE